MSTSNAIGFKTLIICIYFPVKNEQNYLNAEFEYVGKKVGSINKIEGSNLYQYSRKSAKMYVPNNLHTVSVVFVIIGAIL